MNGNSLCHDSRCSHRFALRDSRLTDGYRQHVRCKLCIRLFTLSSSSQFFPSSFFMLRSHGHTFLLSILFYAVYLPVAKCWHVSFTRKADMPAFPLGKCVSENARRGKCAVQTCTRLFYTQFSISVFLSSFFMCHSHWYTLSRIFLSV